MMRFMSHLGSGRGDAPAVEHKAKPDGVVHYDSALVIDSKSLAGVRFAIYRVSFGRRMELSRKVREITRKAVFLEASTELHEKIEANILAQEIDAMYLEWGLIRIDGLMIDGEAATASQLLAQGPDALAREIVETIKEQCGLLETERKN